MSDSRDRNTAQGLLRFLETKRPLDELKIALAVVREFKALESRDEWVETPFIGWLRFEQFEDYLKLLTGDGADEVKDGVAKMYFATIHR
jgi:hypothetical protein